MNQRSTEIPLLNKKRSIPEPTRDEPIRRDHAPPTISIRGEEDEGKGSPSESDSEDALFQLFSPA